MTLAATAISANWTFVRPADRRRDRTAIAHAFGKDGTTSVGEWQDSVGRQLIVGDRFEGMLVIEVRLLGRYRRRPGASGYQGVLVSLEYPDAPAGVDNADQRFLTGVQRELHLARARPSGHPGAIATTSAS